MLSCTVRCGKRLYCWKTTPMRARTASTSTRGSLMSVAAEPDAPVVDRLEQVDGAQQRRLARSARADERDDLARERPRGRCPAARRGRRTTSRRPRGAGRRARAHTIPPICSRARTRAVYQSVRRIVGIASSTNSRPATTYGREVEVGRRLDLRGADGIDRAEQRDEADVLLQRDEVVHERGRDLAHGLRHDDQPHRLTVAEPERARRVALRRMHRLDPRAEHLGHVGRVGEGERDRAPELGRQAHRDQLRARGCRSRRGTAR